MRKPSRCFVALTPVFAWVLAGLAAPVGGSETLPAAARLSTFSNPSGETYFALSLNAGPAAFRTAAGAKPGIDLVALLDTSASQAGPYRTDSIAALRTFAGDP